MKFGAEDTKAKEQYDLIVDNQVDFIKFDLLEEIKHQDEKKEVVAEGPKEEYKSDIQRAKESLPVFKLRYEFLEAVKEN